MRHKLPDELAKWYDEDYCLEAVKKNGWALQYVNSQTPEICLEAIKQNGWALRYVKEQNIETILAALEYDIDCSLYIKWNHITADEAEYIKLKYLN